ncbi:MAG TPA: hypothetical protein VEL07_19910 [Planctomycetota bacterium]|nr:hypothetical protein [Planctomycetota bacterium]
MEPDVVLRLSDDAESYCRLVDPATGPIHVPISEINAQGALLDTRLPYQTNDYIDLTLILKGQGSRPLFAHVVTAGKDGVHLRWLHFDPADEKKLRQVLLDCRDGRRSEPLTGPKAAGADRLQPIRSDAKTDDAPAGTRRVVRPSVVIEPFAGEGAKAGSDSKAHRPAVIEPFAGAAGSTTAKAKKPATSAPAPASDGNERVGTRRVVRPSQKMDAVGEAAGATPPAGNGQPTNRGGDTSGGFSIGEDSGSNNVVLEATNRFTNLPDATSEHKARKPGEEPSGGTQRVSIMGTDGKLDIGASIRSKAKTVRASELAARHDRVRVLNLATIKSLIQEAVQEAMQHLGQNLTEHERKRLMEEAEEGFKERLKEMQAGMAGAEAQAKLLSSQLKMAQDLLEQERKRTISADQFTVSEAGLGDIESAMQKVLERAISGGNVTPELQEQLRKLIAGILDSERQRIREQELTAQNDKIALLEKKISRLAGSLDETERQRDEAQELARQLEAAGGGGLRNVFTAGIKDSDTNKKRKLALMKEILVINRKIRDELGIQAGPQVDIDAPLAEAEKKEAERREASRREAARAALADATADSDDSGSKAAVAAAPAEEPAEEPEAPSEPEIDPDDMAWDIKPVVVKDEFDGSVKRVQVKDYVPPPLERKSGT